MLDKPAETEFIAIKAENGPHVAPASETKAGRTIQSVDRALSVLEAVASKNDGTSVSDIAQLVGLNISTCHHLLTTLVQRGYLAHLGRTRGYALGPKLRELVEVSQGERDPAVLLTGDIQALSKKLGHGMQFAVLSDTSLMTKISIAGSDESIQEPDEVEKMTALHATATGKAILAWIPDTELVRIISANGLNPYTSRTITSLSGLVEELRLVRRSKVAIDDEEFRDGIVCIGSAIREGGGAVIGSISVTTSADRANEKYRQYLVGEIVAAANTFSNKLHNFSGRYQ
ncbi:MAG: IclR family transcriptional regulator [Rhizobiaceae bacterium]